MAIIKAVSSRASIAKAIKYVTQDEKTKSDLITGIGCSVSSVIDEMEVTKLLWGKTGGRTYKHFIQSFHEDEKITAEEAHQIALEWVEKCEILKGFECLIATHDDKAHIHSHIIVNSVNFDTGKKFNMKKSDLSKMKDICNKITKERGLSVPEKGFTFEGEGRETVAAWNRKVYEELQNASDWRYELAGKVLGALECSPISQDEYESELEELGIGIKIRGKTVTYFDLKNEKLRMRDNKIEQYFNEKIPLGKDELNGCFEKNAERERIAIARAAERKREAEERAIAEKERERRIENREGISSERDFSERNDFVESFGRTFEIERTTKQSNRTKSRKYEKDEELEL